MVTPNRLPVIENIRYSANHGDLNCKVEVGDPEFTNEERCNILNRFWTGHRSVVYKSKNFVANRMNDLITWHRNKDTEIVGMEKLEGFSGGAVITSNHFNPDENTVIRLLAQKLNQGRLYVVSQDTNLAMTGMFGFFMNYADIIPISNSKAWMGNQFPEMMADVLKKKHLVLMYPEQEMWFNYRKPRPCKRGAHFYAAKNNVPIISCFVEIQDTDQLEAPGFYRTRYVLHVLGVLYPDGNKTPRENSMWMCQKDYQLKREAYERIYGKPLTYEFSPCDIAGWIPEEGTPKHEQDTTSGN